jgi:hypothetical protein
LLNFNVTMDNFVTSLSMANKLLAKKTSLARPHEQIQELPPSAPNKAPAQPWYSTTVLKNDKMTGTR